jgi:hypothetical protein
MANYCIVADVEAITGELTAAQISRAARLIEAAETYLNGAMGRAWQVGEQELEMHHAPDYLVRLVYWPVQSVTGVFARSGLGSAEVELTSGVDWEVYDLAAGLIRLVNPAQYDLLRVTYVPVDTVPEDVALACAELAANWLMPTLRPGTYGLDSYSLPDLTVRFARSHAQSAEPPFVTQVIDKYRVPVAE